MITAQEARNKTDNAKMEPVRSTLLEMEEYITITAEKKGNHILWYFKPEDFYYMREIVSILKENGYEVTDVNNLEDSSSITIMISW